MVLIYTYMRGNRMIRNPFDDMALEAAHTTVYNCIHVEMVNSELENLRYIDQMEEESYEVTDI